MTRIQVGDVVTNFFDEEGIVLAIAHGEAAVDVGGDVGLSVYRLPDLTFKSRPEPEPAAAPRWVSVKDQPHPVDGRCYPVVNDGHVESWLLDTTFENVTHWWSEPIQLPTFVEPTPLTDAEWRAIALETLRHISKGQIPPHEGAVAALAKLEAGQ